MTATNEAGSRTRNLVALAAGIARNPRFLWIVKRSILLRSTPKSGTNYLRLLLTNYFCNAVSYMTDGLQSFTRISYADMHRNIFPNQRYYVFHGKWAYKRPAVDRVQILARRYADFMFDHGCMLDMSRLFRPAR